MRKRWLLPAALAAALTFAAPAQAARDYVGLVNPWVEADIGRYFFFQSASSPFGFVKLRPDTSTNAVWGTGYRRNENEVKGFSHIHDWQFSGIQVMPTSGVLPLKTRGDTGWQSHVEHDDSEVAQPGYHRLHLDRYDITAELTSTDRVGIHRYRFEQDGPGEIIVNLGGKLGEANMKDAHVTRVGQALDRGLGEPARRRLRLARHEALLRHPRRPAVRLDARLGARQAARRAARTSSPATRWACGCATTTCGAGRSCR